VTQGALFDDEAPVVAGPPVVAATDGSARPNPGQAAGAWFVSPDCWQALAVEGTSTNNVGELVAVRAPARGGAGRPAAARRLRQHLRAEVRHDVGALVEPRRVGCRRSAG
jgi:hypothetical protein